MGSARLLVALIAITALAMPSVAALADTPPSVRDLVGARAASGESELEFRGFVYIDGNTNHHRKQSFWWNKNTKECVRVTTFDGHYESITTSPLPDCHQTQEYNRSDPAVAVAVGAAALLGVAALASKSHQRGDKYNDKESTAEYERGYRDGLYNETYHNYGRSDAYSDGYTEGVQQRGHETTYRNGHHNGAGYMHSVKVSDLVGARGAGAENEMIDRGFRNVDRVRSGGDSAITIWYNSQSGQCIQEIVADGHVDSLTDIRTHPRCR